MSEALRRGDLSHIPFPKVLAEIWREELSGSLIVRGSDGPKTFLFEKGALAVPREGFPEKEFLRFLLTSGEADLISLARAEEYAQQKGVSAVRSLVELPLFGPRRVWDLLEAFVKEEVCSLFEKAKGDFEFKPRAAPPGASYIRDISVPGGLDILAAQLPAETETIQRLSPHLLELLDLAPHERYLLEALDSAKTLGEIYEASDLGKRETQRILFVFLCLGLAGPRPPKPKTGRIPAEMSLADMDKLFGIFNAKCSAIFKYISKEIGPVALSLVRNSLDDIRGRLDPAFQGFELKEDGRIELKSFLKTSMNLVGDDTRRSFLRSMDEILVAEVLAVKRTLGSGHESALVKSLEKIGGLP
jgi:hypothetical protein